MCKNISLIIVAIFSLVGCNNKPHYPNIPKIEFVEAKKTSLGGGIDSIYIKLKFQDGDGNLGLNDFDSPNKEYIIGDTVRNLPIDEYNCENYIKGPGDKDTIRITRNYNYFNFFVSFYKKNTNNTYSLIVRKECANNNGRFSRFDPDPSYSGALEGTIEYGFAGSLTNEFKNTTLQIGITIQDRAWNKSNEVRTQDIRF